MLLPLGGGLTAEKKKLNELKFFISRASDKSRPVRPSEKGNGTLNEDVTGKKRVSYNTVLDLQESQK